MKINKIKVFLSLVAISAFEIFSPIKTFAVNTGVCGFLPCNTAPICLGGADCEGNALSQVGSVLEISLSFIFVGILVYGVWLIIQAAVKIVRSEGNEEQIQSGYKMIKGAYIGIILIIVGIVGLVIVLIIFNATDLFKIAPSQTPPGINLQ